ncbi:MAG: TrmH family RNA methyltransferase, partial [Candidatus Nomurabacteria bacterium]|nr:TrmH family RNA methyltransferase [Candidatus Nomurabacteria bacterium]
MKSRDFSAQFNNSEIVVIFHNIRSIMNVGAILRTMECFGIKRAFATGWTPSLDQGLPHVREKIAKELNKTALGAEKNVEFKYHDDIMKLIENLKNEGFKL